MSYAEEEQLAKCSTCALLESNRIRELLEDA